MWRRNKSRQWLVFTRGLLDKLLSFIITARTTYTAATQNLSADVLCFNLRRQDVVMLGTSMLPVFMIPPESGRCPICGPNQEFIVIDGQALGCTETEDAHPERFEDDCLVLNIPASTLCVIQQPAMRACITKVLKSSSSRTEFETKLMRKWWTKALLTSRRCVDQAVAYHIFHFFPIGDDAERRRARQPPSSPSSTRPASSLTALRSPRAGTLGRKRKSTAGLTSLEVALRCDDDGNLTLGGPGLPANKVADVWTDREGLCAPIIDLYSYDDDGAWRAVLPFFQANITETVSGMFHCHHERAIRLVAKTLRMKPAGASHKLTAALDGVWFVASFLGRFEDIIDKEERFSLSLGELLLKAVDVEASTDKAFQSAA